ncbi:MAG: serine hydrolase [Cytophagales bacterium]|nr:serine hydrolase [Cytophagales bacterium]
MRLLLIVLAIQITLPGTAFGQEHKIDLAADLQNPTLLIKSIDSLISHEMEQDRLPGAAFIMVHGDQVIHQKGYGVTNLENHTPVSVDSTLFRIGSITKFVTVLGLMKLINDNKINMNDEVNQYLDELKLMSNYEEPVRVWHLMTHTGGFDQKLRGRLFDNPEDRPTIDSFLKGELIQVKPPGRVGSYDTYGITLAGRIIERVSGMSFEAFISENILKKMGMNLSGIEMADQLPRLTATGYGLQSETFVPQKYEYYVTTPASSMDATAADIGRFIKGILGQDAGILSTDLWQEILYKRQFRNAPEIPGFSYGLWERIIGKERILWHGGIMNGYSSSLYLLPEHNLGFFLVYTRDFETGPNPNLRNLLPNHLIDRWFQKPATKLPEKISVDAKRFEGTYANTIYCRMCFEGEGATRRIFSIKAVDKGMIEFLGTKFYAYDPLNFTDSTGRFKLAFREDTRGEVNYVFGNWSSDATYEKLGPSLLLEVKQSGFSKEAMLPLRAMTYRGLAEWTNAAEAYQEIVNLRPYDGRAYHYLGMCLSNAGKKEQAIEALIKAYDLGQWKRHTARMIAELYMTKENLPGTLQWITRIKKDAQESGMAAQKIRDFILMSPLLKNLENNSEFKEMINSEGK